MNPRRLLFGLAALSLAASACAPGSDDARSSSTTAGASARAPAVSVVRALDGRPADVAYADGVLWVIEDERGTVQRLDATTGEAIGAPVAVAAAPASIAVGGGRAFLADALGGLTRVDGASGTVEPYPGHTGASFVDIVADSGHLWLVDIAQGTVNSLDEAGAVLWTTAVPGGAVRAARAAGLVWVTGLEDTVTALDPATGDVVQGPRPAGVGPIGLAGTDTTLWVANSDSDTVSRLDANTGRPLGPAVEVGHVPIAVAIDGAVVWVLNQDSHTLTRLDESTGARLGADVALSLRPRGLVVTPAGVWVVGIDAASAVLVPRG